MAGDKRDPETGVTVTRSTSSATEVVEPGRMEKDLEGGKCKVITCSSQKQNCCLVNFPTTKVTQLFHVIAGLIKIERSCSARMTISILSNGSVKAKAILTHYGHNKELQHMHVTN